MHVGSRTAPSMLRARAERATAPRFSGSLRPSRTTTRRAVAEAKATYRAGHRRRFRPWLPEPGLWFQWDYADGPLVNGFKTWLWCAWLAWSRFRVVLPMARPALATQAVFVFMAIWNEFMKPLLFISSVDLYLLPQGLNAVGKQFAKSSSWNLIMAGSLFSVIPILVLYITLNKHFIRINDQSSGIK